MPSAGAQHKHIGGFGFIHPWTDKAPAPTLTTFDPSESWFHGMAIGYPAAYILNPNLHTQHNRKLPIAKLDEMPIMELPADGP
ncbi:unnamed protein product [Clonostachys rhizophaga]|uniref:Uncharacterized protein n=1 Tax=Clonostachys rhizophaga TaxID=160324 RepID=A0A9N9YKJ9_9HYPO|nr:unnamed protein product [Clonostachys rhizophaga]